MASVEAGQIYIDEEYEQTYDVEAIQWSREEDEEVVVVWFSGVNQRSVFTMSRFAKWIDSGMIVLVTKRSNKMAKDKTEAPTLMVGDVVNVWWHPRTGTDLIGKAELVGENMDEVVKGEYPSWLVRFISDNPSGYYTGDMEYMYVNRENAFDDDAEEIN